MELNRTQPLRVVLTDDNEDDVLLVRMAIDGVPAFEVADVCEDGVELLQRLRGEGRYDEPIRPDLVLLDVNMPRLDGFGALTAIRNDPQLRDIRVVMFSTSDRDEDIQRAETLGADGYRSKPAFFEDVCHTISNLAEEMMCA